MVFESVLETFFVVAAAVLAVLSVLLWLRIKGWEMNFERRIKEYLLVEEKRIRQDAAERSGKALSGKYLEKFVPFLDRFGYDPHDVRWIGDPVDLVIFDGQSAGATKKIVFCEVKSGKSEMTTRQKEIKNVIKGCAVAFEEFRV